MVKKSDLKTSQCVMINGASGGVGVMAVQIAKAMDCHVTAVCSAKNAALVKSLGADVVLDYQHDDILAAKQAYDVFFDCVANQSFFKVKATLKAGGTHIKTTPDLISAFGSLLKPFKIKRPDHIMVKPSHKDLLQLKTWVDSQQLKPIVQQVFPLAEVAQAHQLSETGRVVGKLVLDMQG
jgi:NADPH:quinone reductase-like Zn-dependent oxidoreductase